MIYNRHLIEKALYKHFKGGIYATMFVSQPLSIEEICEKEVNRLDLCITHTESMDDIILFQDINSNDVFHAFNVSNDILVIYVSLDTGRKYARPINMFLSDVDKEKYPYINQKYRFELITVDKEIENDYIKNRSNLLINNNHVTVVFGDGKVGITQALYNDCDVKLPALVFSELDKPLVVGQTYKTEPDKLSKDLFFIFKNEKAITSLQLSLDNCKEKFYQEEMEL